MRLDSFLFQNGYFDSRTKANESIKKGLVLYDGKPVKPSQNIEDFSKLKIITEEESFVSNGGYKLQKALKDFKFDVSDMVFADIGASNGGFTDCLIKNGAKKIFAIDVGESQLNSSLDFSKIVVLDNTNARYIDKNTLGQLVDGVVCDVSFISLKLIIPTLKKILKDNGVAFLLIKPQFECGKEYLGNSGIVKKLSARKTAVNKVYDACYEKGLFAVDFTTAPINEKKNVEYLMMLSLDSSNVLKIDEILNKM